MNNEILRHMLSTMAYRFQKTEQYSQLDFGDYKISDETRTPKEILYHVNDVLLKTKIFVKTEIFDKSIFDKLEYKKEVDRFYKLLEELDVVLKNKKLDINFCKRLVQGPISDIFCHIGQLSMICGLSGRKIPGEDYSSADIKTGNIKSIRS